MSIYGLTHQVWSILSVTLVIGLLAACRASSATPAVPDATATPVAAVSTAAEIPLVVISSPAAGQAFEPGQTIRVQSESVAAAGINRLELMVNDRVVAADEFIPQPNAALITKQGWTPDLPGRYVLQVRAYTPANLVGQSAPVVVEVGAAAGSGAITATPNISTATATPTATPTPTLAQATSTPTATSRPSSAQSSLPTRTPTPTPDTPAATPTPDYPYLQVNAALSLNVRAGPSTQYQRVGALQPGETVRIQGQNDIGAGRWWQISYIQVPDGVGWVSSSPNYSIAFNTGQVPVVSAPSLPATLTPAPTLPPAESSGGLDFTVDRTTIRAGECVTFRWNVTNVKEVYYRGGGVPGDNQTRLECPTWTQYYELRVIYRDGTINSKTIRIDVEGGSTYRTVDMEAGQTIDFDKDGKVSDDDGDDFEMKDDNDELTFEKWDDDDDLKQVPVGPVDSLDVIRKEDCDWALDHLDDTNRIKPFPGLAVCFRTDDGRLGKLRFDDVDDNDARIQWALW